MKNSLGALILTAQSCLTMENVQWTFLCKIFVLFKAFGRVTDSLYINFSAFSNIED